MWLTYTKGRSRKAKKIKSDRNDRNYMDGTFKKCKKFPGKLPTTAMLTLLFFTKEV